MPTLRSFHNHRLGLDLPDGISIVRGGEIPARVRRALAPFGGMEALVKPGETVLIKPNVAWDRKPEQGANTHPAVVAAVVELAQSAGAGKVIVSDISCNDPMKTFDRSGIRDAAERAGARVILPDTFAETRYGGSFIRQFPTGEIFLNADRIINVPTVKHHSLTRVTLGMKNWYGVLGGRRHKLHQNVDQSIVDLARAVQPTFTLMDATRVLMANGPQGGRLSNVRIRNLLAGGTDQVALDAWGASLLDLSPGDVSHIKLAAGQGLGTRDYRSLIREETDLAS